MSDSNTWRPSETKNREAGYMVKCKCKVGGCTRVTIDETITLASYVSHHAPNGTPQGEPVYRRKVTASSYAHTDRTMTFLDWKETRCVRCGKSYKADRIKGVVNTTPCDGRCTHAKGHECECSCGGKNHGSGL